MVFCVIFNCLVFFMQARGPNPEKAGWGARRVGGPKISRFFSLSRHKIRSFLPSLGVFSWNLVVFEAPGRSNVHVWSSLVVV